MTNNEKNAETGEKVCSWECEIDSKECLTGITKCFIETKKKMFASR